MKRKKTRERNQVKKMVFFYFFTFIFIVIHNNITKDSDHEIDDEEKPKRERQCHKTVNGVDHRCQIITGKVCDCTIEDKCNSPTCCGFPQFHKVFYFLCISYNNKIILEKSQTNKTNIKKRSTSSKSKMYVFLFLSLC